MLPNLIYQSVIHSCDSKPLLTLKFHFIVFGNLQQKNQE